VLKTANVILTIYNPQILEKLAQLVNADKTNGPLIIVFSTYKRSRNYPGKFNMVVIVETGSIE
jgi:hypothetical protein